MTTKSLMCRLGMHKFTQVASTYWHKDGKKFYLQGKRCEICDKVIFPDNGEFKQEMKTKCSKCNDTGLIDMTHCCDCQIKKSPIENRKES
jgi:phage FluMu protein Com